jgi:peptidoglycan/LPS O-acetylase OafA/YrhL
MNRDTSIYLDGARFFAALTVVAGHTEWSFAPGLMPFIKDYHLATLAVGIFFVLSGFVIGYAVDRTETDARSYFLNRAARVYSVVIPVLLLTLLLDTCGRWLAPDVYNETLTVWNVFKELAKLLISLTFINQAWHLNISAGYNVPFWSLAYEVPYYVVFGLWYFGGTRWRLCAVALMAAAGPHIAALFSLWLLGFGCFRLCKRIALTRAQGRALLLFCSLCLGMAPYLAQFFSEYTPFGGGIIGFGQFFVVGIPFAGTIVGFAFADISLARSRLAKPIRWSAGATFTIYLLHFPLGFLVHALVPQTWALGARWFGIFGLLVVVCFVIAEFSERRKESWRRVLGQLFGTGPTEKSLQSAFSSATPANVVARSPMNVMASTIHTIPVTRKSGEGIGQ